MSEGWRTFMLWQSRVDEFTSDATHDNFHPDHVGRGSAGAMRALGLADDHVNPARRADEADDDAYFDRIVSEMLTGLVPGAVLQFWTKNAGFEAVKAREWPTSEGHSPLFLDYVRDAAGAVTALRLLDQTGDNEHSILGDPGKRRLGWYDESREIWIAANWLE